MIRDARATVHSGNTQPSSVALIDFWRCFQISTVYVPIKGKGTSFGLQDIIFSRHQCSFLAANLDFSLLLEADVRLPAKQL